MELDQTLTSRESINAQMQKVLDEATDAWGIKVTRVEIKNIQPPKEIEEVMTKQMRAERERRQTVLEAQAHQEAVVSRAEGDKQAKILSAQAERDAQVALAEGRAKSIQLVYEAEANGIKMLNDANISDGVLRYRGIQALKDVADGRSTKIFMPSDITKVVETLGVAGEAMGIGDAMKPDDRPRPKPQPKDDPCITPETSRGGKSAAMTSAAINMDVSDPRALDRDYRPKNDPADTN
jgi:regulator of protease activity HflC (stomatin/prohibitin superfamily)